jgi:hypothetical protein
MIKALSAFAVLGLVAAAAGPALAHHSFAMFDRSKQISVTGTVKEFQYTNPHSWVIVMVPGPGGVETEWGFESEGPSTLLRKGIKHSSLNPGDKVTAVGFPMRDGRSAGSLISVTKADGTVLSFRDNGPPPAGVAPAAGN